MRTTRIAALLAGAACLLAFAAPADAGGPGRTVSVLTHQHGVSADRKSATALHLLAVTTHFASTAPAGQESRFGDRIWIHTVFYSWNGSRRGGRVGYADATGIARRGAIAISAVCHLPGGTIDVLGDSTDKRTNTYAVVGGTGKYAGARGEIVARDLVEYGTRQAVTIRLST
jgi:hypothetical protein